MRLFIAVDVPTAIKEAIESDVVDRLRDDMPGVRWTRPEGRHLTLRFLGNVADERLGEMSAALASATEGHRSFEAAFAQVGGFPNLRRPRVVWVGIGVGSDPLAALARDIGAAYAPLGFEVESRPFRAHLTLARSPRPSVIGKLPEVSVPTERFSVEQVVLFQSHLHPEGARYTPLERFQLS